jgi:class 3 adenylate cyclase
MSHLDAVRQAQGLPPLPFGAALHLGEILWGNIGAADRLDFTAIGPAVNLVSRLEGLCRPLGRSVLISGAVAAETSRPLVPLGEHVMRGIATPCPVFTLPMRERRVSRCVVSDRAARQDLFSASRYCFSPPARR